MSLRIVAGRHRGRRLHAPPGSAVRPTADRAREALFGVLERGAPALRGCSFLDLFAGTGAVGLEALSRGAEEAWLVENAAPAAAAVARNVRALGEEARARLLRADALRLGPAPHGFDLVFLDPPYGTGLVAPALARLLAGGWLAPGARLVAEIGAREPLPEPLGLAVEDDRRHGAARLVFLRRT